MTGWCSVVGCAAKCTAFCPQKLKRQEDVSRSATETLQQELQAQHTQCVDLQIALDKSEKRVLLLHQEITNCKADQNKQSAAMQSDMDRHHRLLAQTEGTAAELQEKAKELEEAHMREAERANRLQGEVVDLQAKLQEQQGMREEADADRQSAREAAESTQSQAESALRKLQDEKFAVSHELELLRDELRLKEEEVAEVRRAGRYQRQEQVRPQGHSTVAEVPRTRPVVVVLQEIVCGVGGDGARDRECRDFGPTPAHRIVCGGGSMSEVQRIETPGAPLRAAPRGTQSSAGEGGNRGSRKRT